MLGDPKQKKLKPVVYTSHALRRNSSNSSVKQIFLLKALQITQDPKKLGQMIGVQRVAEVFKTLDKLSMRKEYHEALADNGVSFSYIVKGLKSIADTAEKDSDKLNALKTFLKSVGMEQYNEDHGSGVGSWEEELLKRMNEVKEDPTKMLEQGPMPIPVYEVEQPQMPESEIKNMEEEDKLAGNNPPGKY